MFKKMNLKSASAAFYVAFGVAVLSLITAVVFVVTLNIHAEYTSWGTFVLLLAASVAFVAAALFGQARVGAAIMACCDFAALIVMVSKIASPIVEAISKSSMTGLSLSAITAFPAVVACVALILVCAVAGNVLAWMKMQKKEPVAG